MGVCREDVFTVDIFHQSTKIFRIYRNCGELNVVFMVDFCSFTYLLAIAYVLDFCKWCVREADMHQLNLEYKKVHQDVIY